MHADSTMAVEVALSEALLNWPYFKDLSLVGAGVMDVVVWVSWRWYGMLMRGPPRLPSSLHPVLPACLVGSIANG